MPSVKKEAGRFLHPNEPYIFFIVRWAPYIEICYAYFGGRGGSQPKSSGFLKQRVAGHAAKFADRLLARTQQATKNNDKRCSETN